MCCKLPEQRLWCLFMCKASCSGVKFMSVVACHMKCLLQGMRDKLPALPGGIAVAGEQLRAVALPAAVIHIAGHLWRLRLIRKKRRRKPARAAAASQGKLSAHASYPKRVCSNQALSLAPLPLYLRYKLWMYLIGLANQS